MDPQDRTWGRRLSFLVLVVILLSGLVALHGDYAAPAGLEPAATALGGSRVPSPAHLASRAVFIPNALQPDGRVGYTLFGARYSARFGAGDATFDVPGPQGHRLSISLRFLRTRKNVGPVGARPATARVNLLLGERAGWRTNVPTFGEIVYPDVWPGVDASFTPEATRIKYEFRVAHGGSPESIRFSYRGARKVRLAPDGALEIETPSGTVRDEAPRTYQQLGSRRVPVASRFVLDSNSGEIGVKVGSYDPTLPLVIDPGLMFATYLGGQFTEEAAAVALDPAGNIYLTGTTYSTDFPGTGTVTPGTTVYFVSKFDPTGSTLLYSTLLPIQAPSNLGSWDRFAVDAQGNAYLAGSAQENRAATATFGPVGPGAFVAKLDPSGSRLVYNVAVGAAEAFALALDATGAAYVTGRTSSAEYPTTTGAFDRTFGGGNDGGYDAIVFKLDAAGTQLVYSTFLGGTPGLLNGDDQGWGIAVDGSGQAYVTGRTSAADFPTTAGAYSRTITSGGRIFISKFNAAGAGLVYSTVLGAHTGIDFVWGIAVGTSGDAYVAGQTSSANFPVTAGAIQSTNPAAGTSSPYTGFLLGLAPNGGSVSYATYLGGADNSSLNGLALGASGDVYVAGSAGPNFPTTPNAVRRTVPASGNRGGVLAIVDTDAGALRYGTYIAGTTPTSVAADDNGDAIVAGGAGPGMTTNPAAYQPALAPGVNNLGDAFVARIIPATDFAWARPASSSSNENATLTAGLAVDGNFATRWSSQFSDPQWLRLDLGASVNIDRLVLHWEAAYAAAYRIEASNDGATWTTIGTVSGGNGGVDDVHVTGTGRYVRIYGTQRGTPWGYSLWEVAVFGAPAGGPVGNLPPAVSLTSPVTGAAFDTGAIITLAANASDSDGSVSRVNFLANGSVVGSDDSAPFSVSWGGVATGSYSLTAVAIDNLGATATSSAVTITVRPPPSDGPPAGWAHTDIGNVGLAGSASFDSGTGTFTVSGAGADIWGAADSFHFVYHPLNGDGQIIARVTAIQNTHTYAKAGVMIRETLAPGSRHVLANIRPNSGLEFLQRAEPGGQTWVPGAGTASSPPPIWLKLIRVGNRIDGFVSIRGGTDPGDWTSMGTAYTTMGSQAFIGLAVTSHVPGVLNRSTFDNVSVTVGPPPSGTLPAPWTGQDVGTVGVTGSAAYSAGTFTVRGSGADIWGTADAFRYVSQPVNGDTRLVARVTSVQNTNPYAKAGLMLRDGTAAGARHVILDIRPNGSIEFMSRAAAGGATSFIAGAARTLPVWLRLTRAGSTVTGSVSSDGTSWTTVGATTTSVPASARIGLAVTSHDNSLLNTSTFDGVSVGGTSPPSAGNIVIYASDIPTASLRGSWSTASDSTSPQGIKLVTPDAGAAHTSAPLASPNDYVDVSFNAVASTPYTLWLRMRALNNSRYNDAVWVQFSDARANGLPAYAVGSTSALLVNLATDGTGSSLSGWGWQNTAYWLTQSRTLTFATSGTHTMRIQVREDGVQIDQIVLSPTTYLNAPPGPPTNDHTIVGR